jgi:arylformamidase
MSDHLTFHHQFSADDFEDQYNLRLRRPDFETTVLRDWEERSEAAREQLECSLDVRYGDGDNQRLDLFLCDDNTAATLVYFHGGYWKSGDKSIYSFIAEPFIQAGVNVIIAGYDLCPELSVTEIVSQAREAIIAIYRHADDFDMNAERITVMGHSAGGHLTQMIMGTHWNELASDLPHEVVQSAISISGISYLEPVRLTASLNETIDLDETEADDQSPIVNHPPTTNAPQLLVVGGGETEEFIRQSQMYQDSFYSDERNVAIVIVPEVDHFDILNVLTDSSSALFEKAIALINDGTLEPT